MQGPSRDGHRGKRLISRPPLRCSAWSILVRYTLGSLHRATSCRKNARPCMIGVPAGPMGPKSRARSGEAIMRIRAGRAALLVLASIALGACSSGRLYVSQTSHDAAKSAVEGAAEGVGSVPGPLRRALRDTLLGDDT